MLPLLIAFLLAPADVRPHTRGETHRLVHVHVRVDQDGGLTPNEVRVALDQLGDIWKRAGVAMTSGRYGEPVPAATLVVSLRIVSARMTDGAGRPVLGWVNRRSLTEDVPLLFVSLTGIRDLVAEASYRGKPLTQRPQALRALLLARAVGRIAAHELGHYLLAQTSHERTGLMQSVYSVANLLADSDGSFRLSKSAAVAARREALAHRSAQRQP